MLFTIGLPKKTIYLATEWDQPWLGEAAGQLTALTNQLPSFSLLLDWIGFALVGYVGALLLLALRHRQPGLFGWGAATLTLAATSLHIFAWLGFIAYHAVRLFLAIFRTITEFFRWILTPVVDFVVFTTSGDLGWLTLSALVILFTWLTVRFGTAFLRFAAVAAGSIALFVGIVIGSAYLLGMVPPTFWEIALTIVTVVALWLFWLFLLATVGQLFLDQLRGTVQAGSGQRGIIMGAISVGSALALLMLLGNAYNAYDFYPCSVAEWAGSTVQGANAPQFDAAVALVVIGFSGLAVLTSLVRLRPPPTVKALGRSLIYTIIGGVITTLMSASSRD
ncbi:hypothetical protein [Actinophytocola xanthii]|uniref:hypothetical protein n=1 Tax=Actinophytocola xanthii TaxID=1912961 RepID=UPI0011780DD8|nr:hypothetical protein [Actinophytocola xanthii]